MACFLFRFSSNSMGDDGTMAKGTRYTPEFRAKAVRLLTESRSSYSSETKRCAGGDGGAEAAAGGEHGIAPGERDIDDGSGFLRGRARPDTALMAACIDEYGNRFKAGPIARSCPKRWTAVSSRRAATACSSHGPSAACGRATRRWPATSWTSMPAGSPPCTDAARCGMGSSARVGIPGKRAATR